MRNNTGIFNSQSYTNEYIRDVRSKPFRQPVRTSVTRSDLESLATLIAAKYDLALFHKNDVFIREYETQLVLLAEFADMKAGE